MQKEIGLMPQKNLEKQIQELEAHMKGIVYVAGTFMKWKNLTRLDKLKKYKEYLEREHEYALSPDVKNPHCQPSPSFAIVSEMLKNDRFSKERTSALERARKGAQVIPLNEALETIYKLYIPWLTEELDQVNATIVNMESAQATGSDSIEELSKRFTDKKSTVDEGVGAAMDYQQAKADKTALKKEVTKFLSLDESGEHRMPLLSSSKNSLEQLTQEKQKLDREIDNVDKLIKNAMTTFQEELLKERKESLLERLRKTETAIQEIRERPPSDKETFKTDVALKRLEEEIRSLDKEIQRQEEKARDAQTLFLLSFYKDRIKELQARRDKAVEYMRQLGGARLKKSKASDKRDEMSREALDAFSKIDADFRKQNETFIKGIGDLGKLIKGEEDNLKKKFEEHQKLLAEIDAAMKNEKLANREAKLKELQNKLTVGSAELALLDKRYTAFRDCVDRISQEQRDLLELRNDLKEELDWMQKLKTADKGLKIYCSAHTVCFPLLLNIGKLVAGENCGPLGPFLVTSLTGLSVIQKAASAKTLREIVLGAVTGFAGMAINTTPLAKIHAYDTGSVNFDLMLGLSYGKTVSGSGGSVKGGAAIRYSAGFSQEDDRRFRTNFTLTIETYGQFKIPELVEAEIALEVMKDKSGMIFLDVYHWAAWLAQKWANIKAMLQSAKLFDVTDRYSLPKEMRKRQMKSLAKISLAYDPQLYRIFLDTMKYVDMPVILVEGLDWVGALRGGITFADTLGVGIEAMLHAEEPKYFKRIPLEAADKAGKPREQEYCKHGCQKSHTLALQIVSGIQIAYSNVDKHAVTDNEGLCVTVSFSPEALQQQAGIQKAPEQLSGALPDWVEKLEKGLKPIMNISEVRPDFLNAIKEVQGLKFFNNVSCSVGEGIQVCFYRSRLSENSVPPRDAKTVLMYWRASTSLNIQVSAEVELGVPGLNMDFGMGGQMTRTYCERLGQNTIAYIRMVFNGFMSTTSFDKKDDPRPKEAQGPQLWQRWTEQHSNNLYNLLLNVAGTKAGDSWVAREIRDIGGGDFVDWMKSQKEKMVEEKAMGGFKAYSTYNAALDRFKDVLYRAWKKDSMKSPDEDDWHPVPISKFQFTFSPGLLVSEIMKSRTQAYKLDAALRSIGPRQGLHELVQQVTKKDHWVTDDKAEICFKCHQHFSFTVRKHHCRECGRVFCSKCSSKTIALPHRGFSEPVKVCDACYDKIKKQQLVEHHPTGASSPVVHDSSAHAAAAVSHADVSAHGGHGEQIPVTSSSPHIVPTAADKMTVHPGVVPDITHKPAPPPEEVHVTHHAASPSPTSSSSAKADAFVPPGFTYIPVEGDGNCMFRAFAVAMGGYDPFNQQNHLLYRQTAVQHMREHRSLFPHSDRLGGTIAKVDEAYLDNMSTPAKGPGDTERWGGTAELYALSQFFQRKIIVHRPNTDVLNVVAEKEYGQFKPRGGDIHLLFIGEGHYGCLKPD